MKPEYRFLVATSFVTLLATAFDVRSQALAPGPAAAVPVVTAAPPVPVATPAVAAGAVMPDKEQPAAPVVEATVASNVATAPTPAAAPAGK
jgi:hypothetical protein